MILAVQRMLCCVVYVYCKDSMYRVFSFLDQWEANLTQTLVQIELLDSVARRIHIGTSLPTNITDTSYCTRLNSVVSIYSLYKCLFILYTFLNMRMCVCVCASVRVGLREWGPIEYRNVVSVDRADRWCAIILTSFLCLLRSLFGSVILTWNPRRCRNDLGGARMDGR